MDEQLSIVEFMHSHPFFLHIDDSEKARILPYIEVMDCQPDQVIFTQGERADSVYFIAKGSVLLTSRRHKMARDVNESFGSEAAFKDNLYEYTAKTQENAVLVKLPSEVLEKLLKNYPELGINLFFYNTKLSVPKHSFAAEDASKNSASTLRVLLAWIFAFIVPMVTYHMLSPTLGDNVRVFLATISCGLVLWSFNIVYEFVPALFILITLLVLGIVPSRIVLEGFSSDSYLLILTLSGIASAIISSGLVYRFVIFMIKSLPSKQSWYSAGLFLVGSIMTPIVPSAMMRTRLMAPLTEDLIEVLKVENQSSLATKIAVSNFYGITSLNSAFFTGSLINFIAMGILPLQSYNRITSVGWATMAVVSAIVLIVTNLFGLSLLFHDNTRLVISKKKVMQQLEILGPLKSVEWHAIIVILFFVAAILTLSFHQIQFSWLSLFLFFALSSLKIIKIKEWAAQTDWSFLLMVGASLGIVKSLAFLNVDTLIKDNLSVYLSFLGDGKPQVLTALILVTILARFVFPIGPCFIIMMMIGIPIGEFYQINLWIMTFSLLVASEVWFFPYQSTFYMNFESFFEGKLPYERKKFLAYNLLINFARILSLYLSMPYWRQIGLL